ncbi:MULTISPECIES: hypothetical protein [unclassified Brevundimonas]|uniref:hypothetical protein n=1 Tax=unclassified Brevundimonas TaxID=2622653 RepID=UPI0025C26D2F|nr:MULTISPECIES: hypothetical protein [unclassified Brevundimonas]
MSFYSLSEDERVALTEAALREGGTLKSRWEALADEEANPWTPRSARAARLLGPVTSLLDVGCGTMGLEKLVQAQTYIPSDIVARDERTIVRDYNRDGPPPVAVEAVAVLGVLEYLLDPEAFMRDLNASRAVVTYCPIDAPHPLEPRRSHAWVSDMDHATVVGMFSRAGWTIVSEEALDGTQTIWLLARV